MLDFHLARPRSLSAYHYQSLTTFQFSIRPSQKTPLSLSLLRPLCETAQPPSIKSSTYKNNLFPLFSCSVIVIYSWFSGSPESVKDLLSKLYFPVALGKYEAMMKLKLEARWRDQCESLRVIHSNLRWQNVSWFTDMIQTINRGILCSSLSLFPSLPLSRAFSLCFWAFSIVHIVQLALLCSLSGQLQIPWQI